MGLRVIFGHSMPRPRPCFIHAGTASCAHHFPLNSWAQPGAPCYSSCDWRARFDSCNFSTTPLLLSTQWSKCTTGPRERPPLRLEPALISLLISLKASQRTTTTAFLLECALTQATLSITNYHERRLHRNGLTNRSARCEIALLPPEG